MMETFRKNCKEHLAINYFCEKNSTIDVGQDPKYDSSKRVGIIHLVRAQNLPKS